MTVANQEKLKQVQELLKDIYLIADDGSEHQIKYINFETYTAKQAKKKKANENKLYTTESTKWGQTFYSISLDVIIEKEEKKEVPLIEKIIKDVF